MVKFKKGASLTARTNAFARINGNAGERILTRIIRDQGDNSGVYFIKYH